jgi:hypothetical protein
MKRFASPALAAVLLLAVVGLVAGGCGGKNEMSVSGKVTVEGEPVDTGSITFTAADGKTYVAGGEIQNGQYKVSIPPGKKKVQIRALKKGAPKEVRDEVSGKTYSSDTVTRMAPAEYEAVDSPLEADVTKNGEEFNFDLKKKFEKK